MPLVLNQKYGRLRSIERRGLKWLFACDCGTEKEIVGSNVLSGATKSCGCLNRAVTSRRNQKTFTTHGLTKTPEFRAWQGIHQRCGNPKDKSFKNYGGRGIGVCSRWDSFENFHEDMGAKPSPQHSLDRVDVNGNYEPANCRWATAKIQQSNKRRTLRLSGVPLAMLVSDTHSAEYQRLRKRVLCHS